MIKKKELPLLAMVGLLAISYGFDEASISLQDFRARTFIFTTWWVDLLIEAPSR